MAQRRPTRRTRTVDAAIADLDDASLQCRDFGHSWRPFDARWIPSRRQYDERLQCGRCKTLRVRLLDSRGGQLAAHYVYPDGYLVKGLGRLTGTDRDALRLAGVQLLLDQFAAADKQASNVKPFRRGA